MLAPFTTGMDNGVPTFAEETARNDLVKGMPNIFDLAFTKETFKSLVQRKRLELNIIPPKRDLKIDSPLSPLKAPKQHLLHH